MISAVLGRNLRTPLGTFVAGHPVHVTGPDQVCVVHTPTRCHIGHVDESTLVEVGEYGTGREVVEVDDATPLVAA